MSFKDLYITFRELATCIHYDQKLSIMSYAKPEEYLLSAPITLREMKFEEFAEIEGFKVAMIKPENDFLLIYLEDV